MQAQAAQYSGYAGPVAGVGPGRQVKGNHSGTFHAEGKPAQLWLANLARAVSGIPRTSDTDHDATLLSGVLAEADPGTIYPP
jgi:hypothetical protein